MLVKGKIKIILNNRQDNSTPKPRQDNSTPKPRQDKTKSQSCLLNRTHHESQTGFVLSNFCGVKRGITPSTLQVFSLRLFLLFSFYLLQFFRLWLFRLRLLLGLWLEVHFQSLRVLVLSHIQGLLLL